MEGGKILRTEKPLMEAQRIFKGRGGVTHNFRKYHLYILKPESKGSMEIQGMRFVKYVKKRGKAEGKSKAKMIYGLLERNRAARSFQGI